MKTCYKCKIEKKDSDFGINKSKSDTLSTYCKVCRRDYDVLYNKRRDKKAKYKVQRIRELHNKKLIRGYLLTHPCTCGESRIECLDFHHLENKMYNISNMCGFSQDKILAEIAKCQVLCSNCHRVITAKERNWYVSCRGETIL